MIAWMCNVIRHKRNHVAVNPVKRVGLLLGMFLTTPAFAFSFGTGQDKLTAALGSLGDYLASGPAAVLGLVAIIGVGYATLFLGKLPKEKAMGIVLGLGIVYGAGFLLHTIFGVSA